jgi:hypothetical protein
VDAPWCNPLNELPRQRAVASTHWGGNSGDVYAKRDRPPEVLLLSRGAERPGSGRDRCHTCSHRPGAKPFREGGIPGTQLSWAERECSDQPSTVRDVTGEQSIQFVELPRVVAKHDLVEVHALLLIQRPFSERPPCSPWDRLTFASGDLRQGAGPSSTWPPCPQSSAHHRSRGGADRSRPGGSLQRARHPRCRARASPAFATNRATEGAGIASAWRLTDGAGLL